jgi:hypothetical protein
VLAAERAALAAAQRAMGAGGLYPPGMLSQAPQDEEEKAHRNQLPSPEHGLFALDQRASAPVIGALTNKERNVDF